MSNYWDKAVSLIVCFTEWSMQTSDRNPVPAWWTPNPPKCHDCRPQQSSEGRRWIPSACFQMKSLSICVGTWTATHCLSLAGQLDIWTTPVPDSKSNPISSCWLQRPKCCSVCLSKILSYLAFVWIKVWVKERRFGTNFDLRQKWVSGANRKCCKLHTLSILREGVGQ